MSKSKYSVMINKLCRIMKINPFAFVKWNYLSKNVIRDKGAYIIPQWRAVIDISREARLELHEYIKVNCPKYKYSKEEARLILHNKSALVINGTVHLASGVTVEVHNNATLILDGCFINHDAAVIIEKDATIGHGCLIGRGAKILDSDFHAVYNESGERVNMPKPLVIGEHVWIGIGSIILRGSNIESGAVISAGSVVMGKIKGKTSATGNPARSYSAIRWEE